MKILVTGAAGFIGSNLAEKLAKRGDTVIGLDNLNDYYDPAKKRANAARLAAYPTFRLVEEDIRHRQAMFDLFAAEKFDAVAHLAAMAGVRNAVLHPDLYVQVNLNGTQNLMDAARAAGNMPNFVMASTSSVYGNTTQIPFVETDPCDRPLQPYAAAKRAAEMLGHAYHHLYGIDVSIVRYFTVYGPAGRPDLALFRFVQWVSEGRPVRINGDGKQSRGFTYIDDIARGTILALKPLGYEVLNLGGHQVITINDLVSLIEDVVGKKAIVEYGPPNPADMFTNWADVTKAGELLGWEPQFDMRAGVERLVAWYKSEREWAKDILTP